MRPSIYIGLGGTGIRILAEVKKHYEEYYGVGKIPPIAQFLAIDYDSNAYNDSSLATSIVDDALSIPFTDKPNELILSRINKGDYSWMFPSNSGYIDYCAPVRTTGRFYTEYFLNSIETELQYRWRKASIANVDEDGIPFPCEDIDIYILTSLCGGTGAGSFINIAELTRRLYGKRCNIIGYGVLHNIFQTRDPLGTKTQKLPINTYSTIMDLDYLMHATPSKPVKFTINGAERVFEAPLFDLFYVIDNKTNYFDRLARNIQELCSLIGLHIYTRSTIPVPEVPHIKWKYMRFDGMHKTGWVSAMGAMRVIYRGDLLAKIYSCKAAVELIRKMRQEGSDIAQKAIDWTVTAKVREDEGNDLLINFIYSAEALGKLKGPKVSIQDSLTETRTTVQNYINTLVDFPEAKILAELQAHKERLLKAELVSILNYDGGVGNALKFLKALTRQLDVCRSEMEAEAATMKLQMADKAPVLEKAQKEYEEYCDKFFKTAKGKQEWLDVVSVTAKGMLKLTLDIKRREAARDIFVHLLDVVEKYAQQIQAINELLENLSDAYEVELSSLINEGGGPLFEYDLSLGERTKIAIKTEDIDLAGFISKLPKSLLELDVDTELKPAIDSYATKLPQAETYRTKSIAKAIHELDGNAFSKLCDAIIVKSRQMLLIHNRNIVIERWRPEELLLNHSYICCANNYDDDYNAYAAFSPIINHLQKRLSGHIAKSPNDAGFNPQEMVIYHTWEAVIPYCIEPLNNGVVNAYEQAIEAYLNGNITFNPHFDKVLFDQMRKTYFTLQPPHAHDQHMFYWVCGQLFGYRHDDPNRSSAVTELVSHWKTTQADTSCLDEYNEIHYKYICFIDGCYHYWDNSFTPNERGWKPIGSSPTANRIDAYWGFSEVCMKTCNALDSFLHTTFTAMDESQIKALIKHIKAIGVEGYIDQILCTGTTSSTYASCKPKEMELIRKEWEYIVDKLEEDITVVRYYY